MSLDCFGKIILKGERYDLFIPSHKNILIGNVDYDDTIFLDKIPALAGSGIYIAISDVLGTCDATGLWFEAMKMPLHKVRESSLGAAVSSLLFDERISAGGIAFVDGGIDTVWEGSPNQCWERFLERISKPWDAIDNPLLIW